MVPIHNDFNNHPSFVDIVVKQRTLWRAAWSHIRFLQLRLIPQAKSNPQTPYCYPDAAFAEFKRFMRTDYLPSKLPGYLAGKVKKGILPASLPALAIDALVNRDRTAKIISPPK